MKQNEVFDNHKCNCIAFLNQKGIQEMEEAASNKVLRTDNIIYDLSGRRLNNANTHGVYIKNGNKYVIR